MNKRVCLLIIASSIFVVYGWVLSIQAMSTCIESCPTCDCTLVDKF